ncbi:STAS domain-containing protein [Streptomyces sp. NBC_00523]|uniref:STAS domain-containing protein n=1 Tax=Streptomyces sp. NBC_00523 TaxID=2975765 RepID=UPI002E80FBB7|nr:STAS domain-containing protein [Streptomyces sp. NBC_00523]WUD01974.1 STAS domain-containing protein [Streptomyces sp. NBC_00523]
MNPEQPAAVVVLPDPLTRADVPRLCTELAAALTTSPTAEAACDTSAVAHPDLTTIEAIARLSLTARRMGAPGLRLHGTPPELRALLGLVGLGSVMEDVSAPHPPPDGPGSRTAGTSGPRPGSSGGP